MSVYVTSPPLHVKRRTVARKRESTCQKMPAWMSETIATSDLCTYVRLPAGRDSIAYGLLLSRQSRYVHTVAMSTRYKARTARNKAFPDVYGARIHIHIFLVVARFVLVW